ncbi:MAG: hypothetical protein WCV86_05175, partial [Patescibacteria group bacterium]
TATTTGANSSWTIGADHADGGKFKISSSTALGTNDRLVIDGNGNVGINTASPTSFKLQVAGNVGPNANNSYDLGASSYYWRHLFVTNVSSTNIDALGYVSTTNLYLSGTSISGLYHKQGGNAFGTTSTVGTTDNYNLTFKTNDTSRITVLNNGRIGIGTTAPQNKLVVRGEAIGASTVQGTLVLDGAYSAVSSVQSLDFLINGNTNGAARIGVPTGALSEGELAFYTTTNYANVTPTEKLRIDRNGNVGIGTTNPYLFKLTVAGTIAPSTTNSYDLGGTDNYWRRLYATNVSSTNIDALGYVSSTRFYAGLGTVGAPAFTFQGDPDTGIYHTSDNSVGLVSGGSLKLDVGSSWVTVYNNLSPGTNNSKNLGSPTLSWANLYVSSTSYLAGINAGGTITPRTTNTYDLGASSYYWRHLFVTNVSSTNVDALGYVSTTNLYLSGTSISGLYHKQGGNAFNTTSTIGTTDAKNVTFVTGGTSKMTILNSGSVGIGTVNPSTQLEVYGPAGAVQIKSTDTVGYARLVVANNVAGHNFQFLAGGDTRAGTTLGVSNADLMAGYSNNTPLAFGTADNYDFTLGTNNAAVMTLKNTGNVGIGTSNPYLYKLTVAGTVAPSTTNSYDLGSAAHTWRSLYVGSTSYLAAVNAAGNIIPTVNNQYDLGSATLAWRNVYASGTIMTTGDIYARNVTSTGIIYTGATRLTADAGGPLTLIDEPLTATPPAGTRQGYIFAVGSNPFLDMYAQSNGAANGVQNASVRFYQTLRPDQNNSTDIGAYSGAIKNLFVSSTSYLADINAGGTITPRTTLTYDLGSSSNYWRKLFATNVSSTNIDALGYVSTTNLWVNGSQIISANPNLQQVTNQGYVTTNPIRVNGVSSTASILPTTDHLYDLGIASMRWRDLFTSNGVYASGTLMGSGVLAYGQVSPGTTLTYDLGTSSLYWRKLFVKNVSSTNIDALGYVSTTSLWVNGSQVVAANPNLQQVTDQGYVTTNPIVVGGITTTGDIIPSVTNTIDLGSTTTRFGAIYVGEVFMGGNSLYMNDKKVLESLGGQMNFTADSNQTLQVQTSGSGNLQFNSAGSGNVLFTSTGSGNVSFSSINQTQITSANSITQQTSNPSANIVLNTLGANSQIQLNAIEEIDLTAPFIDINGNADISGTLTLGGDPTLDLHAATKHYVDHKVSISTSTLQQVTDQGATTNKWIQFAGATSTSDFRPGTTASYYLGSANYRWKSLFTSNEVYASGTLMGAGVLAYGQVSPGTTLTYDLGTSSLYWRKLFVKNVSSTNIDALGYVSTTNLWVNGSQIISANPNLQQVTNQGYVTTNPIRVNGVSSTASILPTMNNAYDLGSSAAYWRKLFVTNASSTNIDATGYVSSTNLLADRTIKLGKTTGYNLGKFYVDSSGNVTASGTDMGLVAATSNRFFKMNMISDGTATLQSSAGMTISSVLSSAIMFGNNVIPNVTNLRTLGDSTYYWKKLFATNVSSTNIDALGYVSTTNLYLSGTSISGLYHKQGGNAFNTTSTIGTTDANNVTFVTGGTSKMTILSGGNVGVGVVNPHGKLAIAGLGGNQAGLDTGTYPQIAHLAYESDGTGYGFGIGRKDAAGANYTDYMYFKDGGNVGIGTTNPYLFKLTVAGSVAPSTTNSYDLGGTANYWRRLYATNVSSSRIDALTYVSSTKIIAGIGSATAPSYTFQGDPNSGFYSFSGDNISVSLGGAEKVRFRTADIIPTSNNSIGLGLINQSWAGVFASSTSYLQKLISSNVTSTLLSVSGTSWLGAINSSGNIVPTANNSYDLGSSSTYWRHLFVTNVSSTNIDALGYVSTTNLYLSGTSISSLYHKQGGNAFGVTSTIGTTDAKNVTFVTGGTSKMTILNGGNVGIGTVNPITKLEVSSDSSQLRLSTAASPSGYYTDLVQQYDSTYPFYIEVKNKGRILGSKNINGSNATFVSGYYGISFNTGALDPTTADSRMLISQTGNVGIGTVNPYLYKLTVAGTIAPSTTNLYDLGASSYYWRKLFATNVSSTNIDATGYVSTTNLYLSGTSISGLYHKQGGNAFNTTSTIGTTDANNVTFVTGGTSKMT